MRELPQLSMSYEPRDDFRFRRFNWYSRTASGSALRIASMTLSKATSAEWAACSAGGSRFGLPLSSGFFAGTSPSLSALLGVCAEAVPSGATSARRYEQPERIGFVARVVAELEFAGVERQIGFADLVEIADDAAFDQRPEAFDILRVHRADDVLLMGMGDDLMRVFAVQPVIADPFLGD